MKGEWLEIAIVAGVFLIGSAAGYCTGVENAVEPDAIADVEVPDDVVATGSSFEVGAPPVYIDSATATASDFLAASTTTWFLDDDDVEVRTGRDAFRHDYCTLPVDPLEGYLECFGPRAFYRPYSWDSVTVVEDGER